MNNREILDTFTKQARKVLDYAQEEAQRFQHDYIGTEHLLLGLICEGEGVAAKVLSDLGVELDKIRTAVKFIGDRVIAEETGLTPRTKKVIELAVDEARSFNHDYVGTEHLLLGLLREGEGIAVSILYNMGVDLKAARRGTLLICSLITESHPAHALLSVPQETAILVAESDSVLLCNICEARCPSYFTYCFHCGSKLKEQEP